MGSLRDVHDIKYYEDTPYGQDAPSTSPADDGAEGPPRSERAASRRPPQDDETPAALEVERDGEDIVSVTITDVFGSRTVRRGSGVFVSGEEQKHSCMWPAVVVRFSEKATRSTHRARTADGIAVEAQLRWLFPAKNPREYYCSLYCNINPVEVVFDSFPLTFLSTAARLPATAPDDLFFCRSVFIGDETLEGVKVKYRTVPIWPEENSTALSEHRTQFREIQELASSVRQMMLKHPRPENEDRDNCDDDAAKKQQQRRDERTGSLAVAVAAAVGSAPPPKKRARQSQQPAA